MGIVIVQKYTGLNERDLGFRWQRSVKSSPHLCCGRICICLSGCPELAITYCVWCLLSVVGLWLLWEAEFTSKVSEFQVIMSVACAVSAGNTQWWNSKRQDSSVSKEECCSERSAKRFSCIVGLSAPENWLLESSCHCCAGQTVLSTPQWHLVSMEITKTVAGSGLPLAHWILEG